MRRIAVLTSGGDAPGMNAAIRAVVRTGLDRGWEVFGARHGYAGLIAGDFLQMSARDVGGIIQRGGTLLGSARCEEFKTDAGRRKALEHLQSRDIGGLIIIGGDGSQTGAHEMSRQAFPSSALRRLLKGRIAATPLSEVVAKRKTLDLRLPDLARVLAK